MNTVAVLAGTPVDTQMGMDVLARAGRSALPFALAENPRAQTAFQISSSQQKHAAVLAVLEQAMAQGCGSAFVYCNSLVGGGGFSRPVRRDRPCHRDSAGRVPGPGAAL